MLEIRSVDKHYGSRQVLRDVSFTVENARMTGFVGGNGAGKTTTMRIILGVLAADSGTVLLDGADIARVPTREVARRMGLLPQSPAVPAGLTVEALVRRGRFPHQGLLRGWTRADQAAVDRALDRAGIPELRERGVDELSGGQRQRAWIALTLAQETPLLLLDEPTTYLDLRHQLDVLDLISGLVHEGRTAVAVLHDLVWGAPGTRAIVPSLTFSADDGAHVLGSVVRGGGAHTLDVTASGLPAGYRVTTTADPDTAPDPEGLAEALRPDLLKAFKPAFLGRLIIVPYYPIGDEVLANIIRLKLARIGARVLDNHKAAFEYDEALVEAVLKRCTEVDSGARNVDNVLNGTLLPEIADSVLARMADGGGIARVKVGATKAGKFKYLIEATQS